MHHEGWVAVALDELRAKHLERRLRVWPDGRGGEAWLDFSGNDYLGLSRHPDVLAAAHRSLETYGAGARASRLMSGMLPCHEELESRLAEFKGYPSALVFGSGYHANVGTVPAVVGRDDHVFADRLVHASIIDAIVLSRAALQRFQHNDPEHLRQLLRKASSKGRRLVITESVFSMDGDCAPLAALAASATEAGAMMMVDEAHATGVMGPMGCGMVGELGLTGDVNLSMGTLSKALGSFGGFVACSASMRDLLVNRARAFIYSTALPPAAVGAALGSLDVLRRNPHMGEELLRRAAHLRELLRPEGIDMGKSTTQIIPITVGSSATAMALAEALRGQGILVVAVRPPTVPEGTARLRLSVTLAHSSADLERAASVIVGEMRRL